MNKEEIGKLILQRFAESKSRPDHILEQRWLRQVLMTKLNPKEQDLVVPAIDDLIEKGLIRLDKRGGLGECLILTLNGYDAIYQIDESEVVKRIQKRIMGRFESQNSRVNDIIQTRWITMNLIKDYNPKEQDLFDLAITQMIENGLIKHDNKSGLDCLVLTEKGYETLY